MLKLGRNLCTTFDHYAMPCQGLPNCLMVCRLFNAQKNDRIKVILLPGGALLFIF